MATNPLLADAARDRRWAGLALATALTLASGCMCHKGIELHGDWSLQMNHVPWQHEGAACLGGEPTPHEVAAPLAPAAGPVHRFHPVPTAPAAMPQQARLHPQPAKAASRPPASQESITATLDPVVESPDPAMPLLLPDNNDAVSVLKLKTAPSDDPSWVFRPQAASPASTSAQRAAANRRRLGDGWQSSATRR